MINIPGQSGWKQPNIGDKQGTLWSTFCADLLTKIGSLMVSPRMMLTNDNTTDLGVAAQFASFFIGGTQKFWMIAGKYIWNATVTNGYIGVFAKDASTATPTGLTAPTTCDDALSDMAPYGSTYLLATTQTNLYWLTAATSTWASYASAPFDGASVHKICVQPARSTVYFTDHDTYIRSATMLQIVAATAPTTSSDSSGYLDMATIGAPITNLTGLLPASNGYIWAFGVNQNENGCVVVYWDGVTKNTATLYEIKGANGILAGLMINNQPWLIDNNGRLIYFSGGAFIEAPNGKLPVDVRKFLAGSLDIYNNTRWIHPNGIAVVEGRINILINNKYSDNSGTIEENLPSGIWEYDRDTGWYHKRSLSAYVQATGTITDHGQNRLAGVGALFANKTTRRGVADSSTADGTLLAGAQYYSDASTARYGVWTDNSNDTIQKFGYIVTPKIFSSNYDEMWQQIIARHRKLLNSTDIIWLRYRTSEVDPVEATITWTSTTTATSSTDLSAYQGYEIEVLQGKGSGKCSKITSAVYAAGTTTLTFQETFTGASSGTAKARFQYWIECGKLAVQDLQEFQGWPMAVGPWIQVKMCMQFTGKNQVDDLKIINQAHQLAK